jgi:hypothetical protein
MKTIKVKRRHQFVDDPDMRDPLTGKQWCMCGMPAGAGSVDASTSRSTWLRTGSANGAALSLTRAGTPTMWIRIRPADPQT